MHRPFAALLLVFSVAAIHLPASAQSLRLDRFRAAERGGDAFATRRLFTFRAGQPSLQLTLDYAHDPAVLHDSISGQLHVVRHELVGDFVAGIALSQRVFVFAGIDAPLLMSGSAVPAALTAFATDADGAGLGDARVGGRFLIVGDDADRFRFGADARVSFPLADTADSAQAYRGEESVAVDPALLAELDCGALAISANAGVRVREKSRWADSSIGSEATYAAALSLDAARWLSAYLEGYGAIGFHQFGKTRSLPLEALLGAKAHDRLGFSGGLAIGSGIAAGIGTPDLRLVAQLGWSPVTATPAPAPRISAAPPPRPPSPPLDRDRDGVIDAKDACPNAAEDHDRYQDDDGCPDPDNDGDGVVDARDSCRDTPEDIDAFEDDDGCPDPDNDADGIDDTADACPLERGDAASQGCPSAKIDTSSQRIEIREQVQFETGADRLVEQSTQILEAVQKVLAATPQIHKLRVEGHTDDRGKPVRNLDLSKRRAHAVVAWLADHGIDRSRLEAWGCGNSVPAFANDSDEHRAQNRRVVFALAEMESTTSLAAPPKTCVLAK